MAEGGCRDKLFVDKHRGELIQRANNTAAILAELVSENVIQQDSYEKIRALPTPQQIMRELFSGPLASSGVQGKETFYKILNKHESYLIDDLKRTEYENAMKVETISSVIELLLETLSGLSDWELEEFKNFLLSQTCIYEHFSNIQWRLLRTADMQDTVFSMVQNNGQQSVETTKEVLEKMKRTDLVQRLSDSSSGSKKKHSVDEHLSALIHKVATMRAIKERLLETLSDLSDRELEKFKWLLQFTFFQRSLELISWREVQWTYNVNELVDVMVEKFGQQSVEVTVEVLMDMNRSDLMRKLSETISGHKEKHCMDEHCPALVQTVEMMTSVIELLLETLASLSDTKLRKFRDILLSQTDFDRCVSYIPLILLEIEDRQVTVFLMVQTYGQQSVETTKEVLEKMKRTDLVQRLSDSSRGPKSEHQSALIQKVATMAAVKQLLLETLNDLSDEELKKFKWSLEWIVSQKDLPDVSPEFGLTNDRAEIVDVMLQTHSQQSVPLTREVVKKMNRIDLMQRLSKPSSELEEAHSVDEHVPAVLKKAAVKLILLETLKDLSKKEIEKFKWLLRFTQFQKGLPHIPLSGLQWADSTDTLVDLMVQTCGQQSVEVTTEVFMDMDRTDLVERLSIISSRIKEKQPSELLQKEVTMTPLMEKLLETLEDLSEWELRYFKHVLQHSRMKKSLPKFSTQRLETASRIGMLKLIVDFDSQLSVEVTREVLMKMNRRDLTERLSETSSGLKGPSRSLELEDCGNIMQDSSDWTEVEPEVNSTDADKASTYSLQSEAGNFECSVSGLRWICKEKVSFKYQFCSWEGPIERIESMQYMAAGPLMDITVIAGKLDVVYLPHWICIDDNPTILDKFVVLHIDDCGDVVEKVSEVTSSHVKLSEPVFSPRAVLMKAGLLVKIHCNVLIYKTNTAFLTLHVYLIPCDPGLQQEMDKRELSRGYKIIQKPHPERSLKMQDRFILTADLDSADICPETLKLRHKNINFFEVFIENPDKVFKLKLEQVNDHQPVWTCTVRKDDYQSSTGPLQGEHFVDKHQCALIERVSNIKPILDNLLSEKVIQQEEYDTISAIPTTQEKMRKLYSGALKAAGHDGKDVFYKILEENETYLVADLKRKES
ncbi:uncharacterized protein LOC125893087 isoform X1 [Epinephelus fuscoguttatus]|uniref:uncharacterized protein LOC125893087 isoform X1 n=1 Tax=Epinephelus fuscoguttatus TaxID=293821 RepID=UPI0020D1D387|nr:uncharacterized protein LOC125893087 isoform X1 [Epinephelus fuscoguttatus]